MFGSLLPPGVVVAESATPDSSEWREGLFPEEAQRIAKAVARRRGEFTAGRNLARRALSLLGCAPGAIGTGPSGEPLFPQGVSGSITHTHDYCAAAVARKNAVGVIGIDAELARPLPADVAAYVVAGAEAAGSLPGDALFGTRLFCAKEAFYKAFFQVCGVFVDFQEVAITLLRPLGLPGTVEYEAAVHLRHAKAACGHRLRGRLGQDALRIYAAVVLSEEDVQRLQGYVAEMGDVAQRGLPAP